MTHEELQGVKREVKLARKDIDRYRTATPMEALALVKLKDDWESSNLVMILKSTRIVTGGSIDEATFVMQKETDGTIKLFRRDDQTSTQSRQIGEWGRNGVVTDPHWQASLRQELNGFKVFKYRWEKVDEASGWNYDSESSISDTES